jgi:phosphatidylserine decarboxylase
VNRNILISRQGLVPLLAATLAAVLVLHFIGLRESLAFWGLGLLVLVLFRDPERDIPSIPLTVLSPADGRVVVIEKTDDPYLRRPSLKVTINMNAYGVFTTRSPIGGKVLEPPSIIDGKLHPHGVWLQTDEGDDIVLVMNRGRLNNKPRCYIRFGDRVGQGKRCGFVHLGGLVDMYLPENSQPLVAVGAAVQAGSDVIARLIHG